MLPMPCHTRALFIGALLLTLCSCAEERREQPVAIDGILDLSNWDFEKDGIVDLKGEWRFVWEEFVEPIPSDVFREKYRGTIEVPATWPSQAHPGKPGEFLPGDGYATYGLTIRLPPHTNMNSLGFTIVHAQSAALWQVHSVDGTQELGVMAQGVPGSSLESTVPIWLTLSTTLAAGIQPHVSLLVHVSNFRHARGGLWSPAELGLRQVILEGQSLKLALSASVLGVLFIFAFYHLLLFMQRPEDKASLFFAFWCGAIALRQWTTSQMSQHLGLAGSADAFELLLALEYISVPLALMGAGLFVHALVPGVYFKRFVYGYGFGLGGLLVLFAILASGKTFTGMLWLYQWHIYVGAAIICIHLLQKSLLGNTLSRLILGAFSLVLMGLVNDGLHIHQVIDTAFVTPFVFIVFVVMQSGILSSLSAATYRKVEHLGQNLRKEVEAQTHELHLKTLEAQEATRSSEIATQEALRLKARAETARLDAEALRAEAEAHSLELEELDHQKTAFFQNMSHELRTPLTLILNPLEDLAQEQPDNKKAAVATKNSRRLLRLVNQLLDFQKLEAGKKELKLSPLDINPFVHACGDYFHSACASKGIAFAVSRDGKPLDENAEPVWLLGEVDALEKVLFNYLSNALKYTPKEGEIELSLSLREARVRLSVRDTGPGISRDNQEKLFQVFSQVDETTTRAYEGTGLGLALVKSLVEDMAGEVGVDSEVGQGSTFWVEFPVVVGPTEPIDVLVVDDDEDILRLIDFSLKQADGIDSVQLCTNARDAIRVVNNNYVRVVVSDYQMAHRDGLSLLQELSRLRPETRRILITGEADMEVMKRAVNQAWIHQVLYKPFEHQELTSIVRTFVEERKGEEGDSSLDDFKVKGWLLTDDSETGLEDDCSQEALAELNQGDGELVLVVDDLPDMRDLIAGSLRKRNYRVATAPNGKRGLEIAKELKPGLVVTDWMMPQMSGPELIEALKGDAELGSVPIVLLTAKSDVESRVIGTETGADAFLGKPFNDQELGSIVKNLLSLKSREREVEALNHQLTEHVLKRYLPPDLVDQIVSGELSMDKPAEMRRITVLFSDLAHFTAASEKLGPSAISAFLNEYLTKMNDIIFEHGGTIDKFIGDAIMVMFGAPQDMPEAEQAKRAADCAVAMQEEMQTIANKWQSEGVGQIRMRIGLHQGDAVVGNFGSDRRSDYTCIGPTVNIAARIESAAEAGHVFMSSEMTELLPDIAVSDAGEFDLKGIDGKRRLYKLGS